MNDFEKWWNSLSYGFTSVKVAAEEAYLAGQSSAEERVKELQARVSELEQERDELKQWLEDQVCEAKDFAYKLESKTVELDALKRQCVELEKALKVADEGRNYANELLALKAQAVEPPKTCNPDPRAPHGFCRNESLSEDRYVCECEYWEPPSTPAAEPVAWMRPEISEDGYVYDSAFRDHRTVVSCTGNKWEGWIPLYTHPAALENSDFITDTFFLKKNYHETI